MTEWIGAVFTSDVGWTLLEELVDIGNRMAGSDGERAGATATATAFEDAGARNVRTEEFEMQGWERGHAAIDAPGGTQECIALPRSPSGTGTGRLVDVGHGLPRDFETDIDGKVVLCRSDVPDWYDRYLHRTEKYYRAVRGGAAAFLYMNHVPGCLPPTGSIGTDDEPIGPIPAVGVSKEVGARLSRRATDETVSVTVDARNFTTTSQNVHADVGPDTEEAVLLTSHIDAHDIAEGAGDNGAGTAVVLELANALADREDDLDTRVHCIAFGAEEVGLLGSTLDAGQRDLDQVKAVVNNDGVGRARTLELRTQGVDELEEAGRRIAERFDHPLSVDPRVSPHSDHWPYVQQGVPGYQVAAETGEQGRGWGHTAADTLDKLEARNLREQAVLLTALIEYLADEQVEIPHRSRTAVREQLEADDMAETLRVIEDWPFEDDGA